MEKEKSKFDVVLLIIIAATLAVHSVFLSLDKAAPIYDEQAMAHQSQILAKGLLGKPEYLKSFAWRAGPASYPPLIHLTALPVTLLSSGSLNAPRWSFLAYWVLLLWAASRLGREIGGREAGWGATLLTAMTPGLFGFSHIYMVDFPLAAWTACILALMFNARDFMDYRSAFLFGLAVAAGLLTKPTIIIYAGPSVAIYLGLLLIGRPYEVNRRKLLVSLCVALTPVILLALPWYLSGGLGYYTRRFQIESFGRLISPGGWRPSLYFDLLFHYGLGTALFLLSTFGIMIARKNLAYCMVLTAIVVPFLALGSALGWVFTRYLLPILPLAAIMAAAGLARIPGKKKVWLILGSGLALLGLVYQISTQPKGPLYGKAAHDRFQKVGALRPQKEDAPAKEIAQSIVVSGRAERTIILLDSPLTERIQSEIWSVKPDAWVLNWFENASIGYVPEDMDEAAEIAYKLDQAKIILAADFRPNDSSSYAPSGNTPVDYAKKVFTAFDQRKARLKLTHAWPMPDGKSKLNLWIHEYFWSDLKSDKDEE